VAGTDGAAGRRRGMMGQMGAVGNWPRRLAQGDRKIAKSRHH